MMFGLSRRRGGTNLITQALEHVGKQVDIVPDPTQLEYHLPKSERFPEGLNIKVWCDYERFLDEMYKLFPESKKGIKGFYDECWRVRRRSCIAVAMTATHLACGKVPSCAAMLQQALRNITSTQVIDSL